MSKKILLVLESFNIGGAERQAFNLALELQKQHYKVSLAAFNAEGPLKEECLKAGLPTIALPGNYSAESFKFQESKTKIFSGMFPLWMKLRSQKADTIIPFTAPCNVAVNFVSKYLPAKTFWNQRDEGRGLNTQNYWVVDRSLANAKYHISNSTEGADFLKEQLKVTKPVHIIHNGLIKKAALHSEKEWRAKLNIPNAKIAVMIANVHHAKDHETAIRAWHEVVDTVAEKPVLVFAGSFSESDPLYNQLKELVSLLKLESYIRFTGFTNDVHGLIRAASLCVFSSHKEGLPNAVLEPMCFGLPVAATDLPGIREALGDDYPYISPHKDAHKLATHIITLVTDENRLRTASERNLQRSERLFSIAKMTESYTQLIEQSV